MFREDDREGLALSVGHPERQIKRDAVLHQPEGVPHTLGLDYFFTFAAAFWASTALRMASICGARTLE